MLNAYDYGSGNENHQISPIIRVLVADNQPAFCIGIHTILAKADDIQFVGETTNLLALLYWESTVLPDVILLGADLVTNSIIESINMCKRKFVDCKIMIMFNHEDETCVHQLAIAGIEGCLLKKESPQEIIKAIRTLSQGGNYISQPLWGKVIEPKATPVTFSELERKILPFIITELTLEEIAFSLHMSERTLKRRLQEIYAKLGVQSRVGATVQIIKLGLA